MLVKLILIITLISQLYATKIINSIYYIDSNQIMLSDIVKNKENDILLFKILKNRYSKKVRSVDLIRILKKYGYNSYTAKSRFVSFIKKSDIDTQQVEDSLKQFYTQHYSRINIKNIIVEPRGYIESLPNKYSVDIKSRAYLSNRGTISIKTLKNKKVFLDYTIDATIDSYIATKDIKRGTELSIYNTKKKKVTLSKFRALPIQKIDKSTLQAKNHIKKEHIITDRDIVSLSIVKKNSRVIVTLNSSNISITFSAKALKDGRYGDTIKIQKNNGKRLNALVIGKNRVEIQ